MQHKLGDKEILSLLLQQQKHLAEEYNHTASHTSDPNMMQMLTGIIAEEQRMRLKIYEAMNKRGWYNPKLIDQSQIDQARQKFSQTRQRLQHIVSGLSHHAGRSDTGWNTSQSFEQNFSPNHGGTTTQTFQHTSPTQSFVQGSPSQPFQHSATSPSVQSNAPAFAQSGNFQSTQQRSGVQPPAF